MKVHLVRHGHAVPEEDAGSDRDRWLSATGRHEARTVGALLRAHGTNVDAIVSSPLPRAVQTAELIAAALGYAGPIETLRCLEPSGHANVARRELAARGASVLVVSHEPLVSALGAALVGASRFPPFSTAQCCIIVDRKPTLTVRADGDGLEPLAI